MQLSLPRVRLPRVSFDWLPGLPGRAVILYTLYTLALFLVFLVVNFPHDVLVQRALDTVDLRPFHLDVSGARFAWWRGYELQGLRLTREGDDRSVPPLLETSTLYVRPGLDGLWSGQVTSVVLRALMYAGSVDGTWSGAGGRDRATLRLGDLDIARYRFLTAQLGEGEVRGRISGAITFESRRGNLRDAQTVGELSVTDATMVGLKANAIAIPELHFGTVTAKFTATGNRIDIEEFRADGKEIKLSSNGQITLRPPLTDSVLNLKVTLQPGPEPSDLVKGMMTLVPKPKGGRPDAPLSLTGTVAQPRLR